MKFLSKPKEFDYKEKKDYGKFHFFSLALTERNWVGEEYITKKDCTWFVNELNRLDDVFYNTFGNIISTSYFTFLMDTSTFAGDLESNISLLEFLEELGDFYSIDENEQEKWKIGIKYLKKLRNFASKPENFSYLYRWSLLNEGHVFSKELFDLLESNVKEFGKRSKNSFVKDTIEVHKKVQKELKKKKLSSLEQQTLENSLMNEVVHKAERRDSEFVQRVLRYGLDEPNLFFYAIYCVVQYFKEFDGVMAPNGHQFISIQKKHKGIEVFFKDSTEFLNHLYLEHETFLDTLPKTKRKASGTTTRYESFYEIKHDDEDYELERIDVLKTIANWVKERIPEDALAILPKREWAHYIKGDLLKDADLKVITFQDANAIGGPNGKELLVKAVAYKESGQPILFPLFDPDSWDNLNSVQCALITYGICLFHDISIENNYELVKNSSYDEWEERLKGNLNFMMDEEVVLFPYILNTNETFTKVAPLQTLQETPKKNIKEKNEVERQETKEHWVSFHFRRITGGASNEAKENAQKYGIKNIPSGFTFVKPYVKGGKEIDPSKARISALDVLNKTLNKLNKYNPIELEEENV